jgi:release factor glutamine methyltransferase
MSVSLPEREPAVWTIGRVLAWAAEDLGRRGLKDSPRLDAEVLLAHALGTDRLRLIIDAQRPLAPGELARFREFILRRRKAEPVAYIVGRREFYGLEFRVDANVLVPRPATETLVDVALARTAAGAMFGTALDVCTGSGCVAIAFARERPTWRVVASDESLGALGVARHNALRLGAVWGVSFEHSDLVEAFRGRAQFDLVTANPPYIPDGEIAELSADIKNHEPLMALRGGADGLALVGRLLRTAPEVLAPGGVVALEVGAGQAPAVLAKMRELGYVDIESARDYGGIERVLSGRHGAAPHTASTGG